MLPNPRRPRSRPQRRNQRKTNRKPKARPQIAEGIGAAQAALSCLALFACPSQRCESLAQARQRQPDYVEVAAINPRDESPGNSLDRISSCLIEWLAR